MRQREVTDTASSVSEGSSGSCPVDTDLAVTCPGQTGPQASSYLQSLAQLAAQADAGQLLVELMD